MKKLLSFFALSLCLFSLSAIPGTKSFIPDASGEYVYYRDYSFNRESYVGLLCYSDSTYQIRYYAPEDSNEYLPEKEIAILVSINPESDFWDMTGENIISTILPNDEDTTLVNYLHDIMYDFSAKRNKVDAVENQNTEVYQEYAQFGGNVKITYDAKIPMFNIRSITDAKDNKMLECCTIGQLKSSEDTSFDSFKGLNKEKSAEKTSKASKKAKATKIEYNNQTLILDAKWTQSMENLWTLGDDSLISLAEIPQLSENNNFNEIYILRKLLESTDNSYIDFQTAEITKDEKSNQTKIKSVIFEDSSKKNIQNVKILTKKQREKGFVSDAASDYYFFSISTYQKAYDENPVYFDKIIKSYSVK